MISLLKQHWRLLACFLSGLIMTVSVSYKMPVPQQETAFNPIHTEIANQNNQQTLLSP